MSQDLPRSRNHLIDQVVFISFKVLSFSFFKISFNSNSLYSFKVVVLDGTWTLSVSLLSILFIWRATSSWNVTPSWINCFDLLRRSTPLISLSLVLLMRNSTRPIHWQIVLLAVALSIHLERHLSRSHVCLEIKVYRISIQVVVMLRLAIIFLLLLQLLG